MEFESETDSATILFVQSNPSQLDDRFYAALAKELDGVSVALLNGHGRERTEIDPELGFTPVFPKSSLSYETHLLPDENKGGVRQLVSLIRTRRPRLVVVQDQTWSNKIVIALACRIYGVLVAFRSDKNLISSNARAGILQLVEATLVRLLFHRIAPISELTSRYYRWNRADWIWWFPYPSSREKFTPDNESPSVRSRLRARHGISQEATVFLVVAKFVDRENPIAAVEAFIRTAEVCPNSALLMVGAGSQERELRALASTSAASDKIFFLGYVPYVELQEVFWASDVYVHLAKCEPWGVSAQDALVAKMGLLTSDKVGAGVCHLTGTLSRFVVADGDFDAASAAMTELASLPDKKPDFLPAWEAVDRGFTAEALAHVWATRMKTT